MDFESKLSESLGEYKNFTRFFSNLILRKEFEPMVFTVKVGFHNFTKMHMDIVKTLNSLNRNLDSDRIAENMILFLQTGNYVYLAKMYRFILTSNTSLSHAE